MPCSQLWMSVGTLNPKVSEEVGQFKTCTDTESIMLFIRIWLFTGTHGGLKMGELVASLVHVLPVPLTLHYLCTYLYVRVPHFHDDSPKRDQLRYCLNPSSVLGSDDDTNKPYFCTQKSALRKARRMADGSCSLPGVEVCRDYLSGVFTHCLFIWYLL